MNTNRSGVTENSFSKIDQDKYSEGWERIFGKKEISECTCGSEEGSIDPCFHCVKKEKECLT